jgi:hypothetical protein
MRLTVCRLREGQLNFHKSSTGPGETATAESSAAGHYCGRNLPAVRGYCTYRDERTGVKLRGLDGNSATDPRGA